MRQVAFARSAVQDLRPLRGALRASWTASSLRLSLYYRRFRPCLSQESRMAISDGTKPA